MTTTNLTATATTPTIRGESRLLYRGMGLVFLATIVVGFGNSTRSRTIAGAPPLGPLVLLHAGLFAAWFVLFFVQSSLVAAGRVALHRTLGWLSLALAALITLDGPLVALSALRRGTLGEDGAAFSLLMIGDVIGFAAFVAAAIGWRGHPDAHRRLMLLASTSLLPPAIFRWPLVAGRSAAVGPVMLVYLAVAPLRDLLARRPVHPASLWGGVLLLASVPLRIAVSHTSAWQGFVAWLLR